MKKFRFLNATVLSSFSFEIKIIRAYDPESRSRIGIISEIVDTEGVGKLKQLMHSNHGEFQLSV